MSVSLAKSSGLKGMLELADSAAALERKMSKMTGIPAQPTDTLLFLSEIVI